MITLDVVIPVYNEGKNILEALESIETHVKTPCTVLICYDDERDTTLAALRTRQFSFPIRAVKNRGSGPHGAVVTGFADSTASAVLVIPADDNYNAPLIDSMAAMIEAGCDIVAASRFMPGGRMEGCPWQKAWLVRASAVTLHRLARVPTHDPTNGLRMFSRRLLDSIQIESTQGFSYSLELLVKCHRLRWKIGQVPAGWFERRSGKSRFQILKWAPSYLRWYFYAFATTYCFRRPGAVKLRQRAEAASPNPKAATTARTL